MKSDSDILTDENGVKYSYNNLTTQSWLDGHTGGTTESAGFLHQKALDLFKSGKHQEATAMQKLGDELLATVRPKQETRAEEHKKNYPAIVDMEWKTEEPVRKD